MYFVFLRLSASPFDLTHFTKLSISRFNFLTIIWIVSPVNIMFASSYIINFAKGAISGMTFMYIMKSKGPNMLPWGTPYLIA